MRSDLRRLATEMAVIVLVAAAVGIAWNFRLLRDVWQGHASTASAPSLPAPNAPAEPLPLGLIQIKELVDSKEAVIIDARDREAFRKGHISGALSLPLGEADRLVPELVAKTPKEKLLVVYCNGYDCHDSKTLGRRLLAAGFGQVFVFEGGFPEWRDAGYPVAQGGE
ncbi:rhodanese-like domain-containing protein [Geobacter pickeringii]|uniref:Sulfurtransferase n=1 Tax=Geobacter pickeringii TaxID=345632 RepID=A0A0B5BCQ7_9BACT|nr:rhodanese-like domain-containing protein [Geobacter pickeringii]AJE04282.1 sulfurtransferase [Geobacter pickeringii]